MDLKFVVFVFLVFFAVLGCIETKLQSSGGVRRLSGRGSPSLVSHRRPILRLSSRRRPVRPRKPTRTPSPHVTTVRPRKPTRTPSPPVTTVRPRKPTYTPSPHVTTGSPIRPFDTVPAPRNTDLPRSATLSPRFILPNSTSRPSGPSAGWVHPDKHPDLPKPATLSPRFILPNSTSRPSGPPAGWVHPDKHPGTNQTPVHTTPGPHHNISHESAGVQSPGQIGKNLSTSIHPTNYSNEETSSGSNPNIYNPGLYNPYPTPNLTNVHISPVEHPPPHSAPPVAVILEQPGYRKTKGDILTEAIIYAGVNTFFDVISRNNGKKKVTPPQGSNTAANITTTHNNNIIIHHVQNPGGPENGNGNTQGENSGNNYPNSGNSENNPSTKSPGGSQIPTNGQSHPNQTNGNGQVNNGYIAIYDDELFNITEKLFSLDENNASRFISLNLQKQLEANNTSNITDQSPQPLFFIQPEAYSIPTVRAIRSRYQAATAIENNTREDNRKEEALFVDLILNTNVMTAAMNFLVQKDLIKNDYYLHRDILKNLWFTNYGGSSSGFKRVFQGDVFEGILWGIQDWIAFDFYEKSGRANYLSYITKTDLGKSSPNTAILQTNFQMDGNVRIGTALFIGISPELQMALYTICYHTRRDNYCDVSLGGTRVRIYTHAETYSGNDSINVAFPILY